MRRRVGLLGGSFNPVHIGHLIIAQDAIEKFELDRLLFVPCAIPPHKSTDEFAETDHRLAMLDHALTGDPRMELSLIEVERGGVSYSVDTVRTLREQNPDTDFRFVIGADTLPELHTWKDIYQLLGLCEFITFQRPGFKGSALAPEQLHLKDPWPERLLRRVTDCHWIDISATEIRGRVAEGMSIRYLVPSSVEMYIYEHGLYKA